MKNKISVYELLGLIKDEPNYELYVKYINNMSNKEEIMWACEENIFDKLDNKVIFLNDKVEILEENKPIIEKLKIKDNKVIGKWENGSDYHYTLSAPQRVMIEKLNEIIECINRKVKGND